MHVRKEAGHHFQQRRFRQCPPHTGERSCKYWTDIPEELIGGRQGAARSRFRHFRIPPIAFRIIIFRCLIFLTKQPNPEGR